MIFGRLHEEAPLNVKFLFNIGPLKKIVFKIQERNGECKVQV